MKHWEHIVKKIIWPLPLLAIGVYGLVQFSQESLPENISRGIAQVELEQEVENKSNLASHVREIISIESEIDLKRERLASFRKEKNELEEKLQNFSHTEQEVLDIDERLEEIEKLMTILEVDLKQREEDKNKLMVSIEEHDHQLAAIRCENQQQTDKLKSELEALLADKAEVTDRILKIADAKDKLSKEIDDLKDLYVTDESKTSSGLFNSNQDMSAFFMAMTSFFFSMNNNQGSMIGATQTTFMGYQPNQTMLMPGQPLPFAHHHMTYQPSMPYQSAPYSILDRDLFAPRNYSPMVIQQQQQQQQQVMLNQGQTQTPVIPMGSRQISSDGGYFTF